MAKFSQDDLIIGVAICAGESFEDTLNLMLRDEWDGIVAGWMKRVRGPWFNRRKVNLVAAELLFRAYLQDGYNPAPVWRRQSAGGVCITAPWEETLKCRLVMAGFSESGTLNGYLPCRWYDYFTVSEIIQSDTCMHPKNWKKVFFTQADALAMKGANGQ
jgi:hypothetical protein